MSGRVEMGLCLSALFRSQTFKTDYVFLSITQLEMNFQKTQGSKDLEHGDVALNFNKYFLTAVIFH